MQRNRKIWTIRPDGLVCYDISEKQIFWDKEFPSSFFLCRPISRKVIEEACWNYLTRMTNQKSSNRNREHFDVIFFYVRWFLLSLARCFSLVRLFHTGDSGVFNLSAANAFALLSSWVTRFWTEPLALFFCRFSLCFALFWFDLTNERTNEKNLDAISGWTLGSRLFHQIQRIQC